MSAAEPRVEDRPGPLRRPGPCARVRARTVLLALGGTAILLFLFLRSRPIDLERHARIERDLDRLSSAASERSIALQRSRSAAGDDDLARADEAIADALDVLETRSSRDDPDGRIRAQVARARELAAEQGAALAAYRVDDGAYRRALRRLPAAVDELRAGAPSAVADARFAAALDALLAELATGPEVEGREEQAGDPSSRLRPAAAGLPADELAAVDRFAAEIDALALQRRDRERSFERCGGVPLAREIAGIERASRGLFESRLRGAELYRLGLYVACIALLAQLFRGLRALRRSARELERANTTLEARVGERTQLLSRINAQLEREVYERKRAEVEARRTREAAEVANRAKSDFLANMSHEIRTPMTSILGFSERLLDAGIDPAERAEAVAAVRRNGEHLLRLINDVLDLSKIEAGRLEIERIPCAPAEIVREVEESIRERAAAKGLDFQVELSRRLPAAISTDPVRLEQVLTNLLANAVKFTESGSVSLEVAYSDEEDGRLPSLSFVVRDTGIGMDEQQVARLFRPFVQADSSTTRRFGGTGLGLSICKRLAELMDGSIAVESAPGRGSTFTFTIRVGSTEATPADAGGAGRAPAAAPAAPAAPGRPLRVLVVEDGEDNRRLLRLILGRAGADVDVSANGELACDAVARAQARGEPFDVVVMDMQMPVLDGYAATARLRAEGFGLPIVALTANAMATDRERCLAAGCDEFCTKPVDREHLLATIERLAAAGPRPAAGAGPRAPLPAPAPERDRARADEAVGSAGAVLRPAPPAG